MARSRLVLITDSANNSLIVRLALYGVGQRGGTWDAFHPGLLYSKGTFQSYSEGVSLVAYDSSVRSNVRVVMLYDFWWVDELWANDSGKAQIYQGTAMNNDDQARWLYRSAWTP